MCVKTLSESDAARLLKWLFYNGCGGKVLGWAFPEYELQDDGSWEKVRDGGPKTWDVPEDRVKWSPVDNHLKGAFRGVVRNVGETALPFITVDLDRHSGEVSTARHIGEVLQAGRLLTSRYRFLRWAVEINPQSGSAKFFGFTGRPIPEDAAKEIGQEIHQALIAAGLGRREVFPANAPKVFLPCRQDKITIIDSGVVPKVMRLRRHADPVECYSAVAFWKWVKAGRSYSEAVLVEAMAAACRHLPDSASLQGLAKSAANASELSDSVVIAGSDTQSGERPRRRKTKSVSVGDLRSEPDSLVRQREALLMFCRANKKVVSTDEALRFIQQQRLYTGDWDEGLRRRTTRIAQILEFIAKTFDAEKCNSSRPVVTLNLTKFDRWARICTGWRGPERVTVDEYGRIVRKRDRTVVGPKFLSVFMSIVEYLLIIDKNQDDTVPQERAKAIWDNLYRTGQTSVKYCPRKWAICRNRLEAMGIFRIDHTHFYGQAMKWWPTASFPSRGRARSMLDPVELREFLKERRKREEHNSLLQHFAINREPEPAPAPDWPLARGSPRIIAPGGMRWGARGDQIEGSSGTPLRLQPPHAKYWGDKELVVGGWSPVIIGATQIINRRSSLDSFSLG
jgi:hypothetical protein